MDWQQLVSQYGYLAILIGTLLEGEMIVILGGFMAHRHYLELHWVIVCAFSGTLFSDQMYYYIGRLKGRQFIESRPTWKIRTEKAFYLLHKYPWLFVLGFRFVYGIRTVTPFAIGASNFPPLKFLILNMIGAGLWALTIASIGYLIGDFILAHSKKYELTVVFILIGIAALGWAIYTLRERLEAKRRRLNPDANSTSIPPEDDHKTDHNDSQNGAG